MAYILNKDRPNNSYEEAQAGWAAYHEYLESMRDHLPQDAYEFATAPWHYDPSDHKSPHDGWLESLAVRELSYGDRRQFRSVEIVILLLAAYHDGHIELVYKNVKSYSLEAPFMESSTRVDWLFDEIRLSERNHVLHEIEWASGSYWLIECEDVTYKWVPLDPSI